MSALQYYNKKLPGYVVKSTRRRIANNLVEELGLNTEAKIKTTTYAEDVALIIKAIRRFSSISVFKNAHVMLQTTLILNLLVDGASRVGEFVSPSSSSTPGIVWGGIDFWITSYDPERRPCIRAAILYKWLKGHTFDSQKCKGFVVCLRPPSLLFQDSCRQLLLLGLALGIFEDVESWEDIDSCPPGLAGAQIRIKEAWKTQPVFQSIQPKIAQINQFDSDSNETGTQTSWPSQSLAKAVQQLSRLTGLSKKVDLASIRRGDAFILLANAIDRHAARRMMGQEKGSPAFITYISETATMNLQGRARGLEVQDVASLSGLSLGSVDNVSSTLPFRDGT